MSGDELAGGGQEQGSGPDGAKEPSPRQSARKVTQSARESAAKAAGRTKATTNKATRAAKDSAAKAAGTVRAARAAREGRLQDARDVTAETEVGEGTAEAIAELEALHYQAVVNKRGLSVSALTKTLNERWDNGWRLAHVLEQRGNTVLVFEKRSSDT